MLRATIVDHRGRRVPLVGRDWEWLLPGIGDRERRHRLLAAAAGPRPSITSGEVRRWLVFGVLMLPVWLAAALAPAFLTYTVRAPWWACMLVIIPLGVLPPLVLAAGARRIAPARIVGTYLRAGLCASCGYDLATVEADGDGCRVCPECGAAWRAGPGGAA